MGLEIRSDGQKPTFNDSERYNLSDARDILNNPNFKSGQTHLYIHGHGEFQGDNGSHVIVEAYLHRNDINLIALDWDKGAEEIYFESIINVKLLAPVVADAILDLFEAGLDRKDLMVVAHSLGSQLAGRIGRQIISKTNGQMKIHRMAVLDPAFPLYYPIISTSVNKNDADHLQVIHTDILTYGQPTSLGHVDFWPNGGLQGQPGCPNGILVPFSEEDLCSHQRSWRFWAESVENALGNKKKFLGFPGKNYVTFLIKGKDNLKSKPVLMGVDCPLSAKGDYFLKTNSEYPFAMGLDGY
ncbi:pancreatic triacylglycerol lipase-like [Episyrphus balteatus]|uniref:pancreatic triacylglycerol lipase-like n=1 Tax=Episyrphus balteatus TaxID=286459 RepID=UPI0024856CC0|nr:pancreatic triacylglycerol lipase-like [Episyrphus balteatus]